jgi:hypothetical protein
MLHLPSRNQNKRETLLIEICGHVDIKKSLITTLFGRNMGIPIIKLPKIDPTSKASRDLLAQITLQDFSPEGKSKWVSLYLIHLIDNLKTINNYLETDHLIIQNYTTAFSVWSKSLDIPTKIPQILPQPNIVFCLEGRNVNQITTDVDFPSELKNEVNTRFSCLRDSKVVHVSLVNDLFRFYSIVNNTSDYLCHFMQKKFNLNHDNIKLKRRYS